MNPNSIAIIIVRIGAKTDRQPFIAHASGIKNIFLSPAIFKPFGNGIPIKNPIGIIMKNVIIILMNNVYGRINSKNIDKKML